MSEGKVFLIGLVVVAILGVMMFSSAMVEQNRKAAVERRLHQLEMECK